MQFFILRFCRQLVEKVRMDFFDKLTGRGLCRALCVCCVGIGMDQESKTAPCAARQRAVYHRAGQDVGKGTQLRGGAGQHVRLIDEQHVEAAL